MPVTRPAEAGFWSHFRAGEPSQQLTRDRLLTTGAPVYRLALLAASVAAFALAAAVATPSAQPESPTPHNRPSAPPPHVPWFMYGGTPARNMVNLHDTLSLPTFRPDWNNEAEVRKWESQWLLWKAELGSKSYAQPVVSGGKVLVGTNNERPRNRRDRKPPTKESDDEPLDKGVLMCFDAASGAFLWQAVHDKLPGGQINDWPQVGVCSIPTVVGDRVYYVSNQCRVVCLDLDGFADGNQGMKNEKYRDPTDADFIWEYDMIRELNVFPHNMSTGCPLIIGDLLFVQTSNGVDEGHINLPSPEAPSFICLNRHTGKLVWKDSAPGKDVVHGQWASPAFAETPVPQVIFPGGDGWLRAFDPPTGRLLWKFECNPKGAVRELGGGTRNDIIAAPVVSDGRVYIGVGQDPSHSHGIAYFWCIDVRKAVERGAARADRDVSPDLLAGVRKRPDGKAEHLTRPNPASALAWVYGGVETRPHAVRDFKFGRTISTACVVDGLVYAAELDGILHCLDAKTGAHHWQYDTKSPVWGAPYYVDGKVLLGTEWGDLFVFRHDRQPGGYDELVAVANVPTGKAARQVVKKVRAEVEKTYLVAKIELPAAMRGTPTVCGGVLYISTENTLSAFGRPAAH